MKISERKPIGDGEVDYFKDDTWGLFVERLKRMVPRIRDFHLADPNWYTHAFDLRVRPTEKVTMRDWLPMKEDSFHESMSRAWQRANLIRNVLDMNPGHQWGAVLFVAKPGSGLSAPLPRASLARRQAALAVVNGVLAANQLQMESDGGPSGPVGMLEAELIA